MIDALRIKHDVEVVDSYEAVKLFAGGLRWVLENY
jgi:hypothetical protein